MSRALFSQLIHVWRRQEHPIITPDKMEDYDGFLIGLSGRFGTMPAQMKVSFVMETLHVGLFQSERYTHLVVFSFFCRW